MTAATIGEEPGGPLAYEEAKRLARFGSPDQRRHLAGRDDAPPEILFFLAADPSLPVRCELAANTATPGKADLALCRDGDVAVRQGLVAKASSRVPDNDERHPGEIERLTLEVLGRLATDEAVSVRRALAEALQDRRHAPPMVMRRLARDDESTVATPVLKHSPVLGDDDLLDIVHAPTSRGAVSAIASRRGVSDRVADAVARSTDVQAITTLLANDSAQIREETLDRLLDEAPTHETWHGPMVRRPRLHDGAIRKLADFVALSLVEALSARSDLTAPAASAVDAALHQRQPAPPRADTAHRTDTATPTREDDRTPAGRLVGNASLSEDTLDRAMAEGRRDFVVTGLAAMAGLEEAQVETILQSQSPRAVVAMAWKAHLSMRVALKIQLQVARIPPQSVINSQGTTGYPMSVEEMSWQLEFFGA